MNTVFKPSGVRVRPLHSVPRQLFGALILRDLPFAAQHLGVSLVHETLPPRAATPLLYHKSTEEVFFVIKGRAAVLLDDRRLGVRTGDTLHIPAGAVHGVVSGRTSVQALSLFSPPMDPKRPDAHLAETPATTSKARSKRAPRRGKRK